MIRDYKIDACILANIIVSFSPIYNMYIGMVCYLPALSHRVVLCTDHAIGVALGRYRKPVKEMALVSAELNRLPAIFCTHTSSPALRNSMVLG